MKLELSDDLCILHFDDSKANVIGHEFMDGLNEGLDKAEHDAKAVVLVGRPGLLSAGFDLNEIKKGPAAARAIMHRGAAMMLRLFSWPQPLVIACTGHAIAAGAFVLLTADNRVGTAGDFKIGLNETSIDATFPVFAIQLARTRLNPAYLTRSFVQSELFSPDDAVQAGFLDEVVPADKVIDSALTTAQRLSALPAGAYAKNKQDIRDPAITAIRASLQTND